MDFTQKARWVKDGHLPPDRKESNYSGVVSRDIVIISLTYAALSAVGVSATDIQNAYLQAPSSENHYVICGKEFGLEHKGKDCSGQARALRWKIGRQGLLDSLKKMYDFLRIKILPGWSGNLDERIN